MYGANTKKGYFRPQNPKKYRGDIDRIIFRSSWEHRVMLWLDLNDAVLEWASEETVIPYVSSVDGRKHRYFVDFWAKIRQKDGSVRTMLLEIKPEKQTRVPRRSKDEARALEEAKTYLKNQDKWKAAQEYCAANGMSFFVITEDVLGLRKPQRSR